MTLLHSFEFATFWKYNFALYFCAFLKRVYFVHKKHIPEQQAYSFVFLTSHEFRCAGEFPHLQECIPVGCVPSAAVTVSPGGVVSQHALRQTPSGVDRQTPVKT